MDRRTFLEAAATGTIAGLAAPSSTFAAEGRKIPRIAPEERAQPMDVGPRIPMDRDRAKAILAEYDVDGIVALQPYNVYYITNTVPVVVAFNSDIPALGVFGRETGQSLYVGSTGSLWDLARDGREVSDVVAFTGLKNPHEYLNASPELMKIEPAAHAGGYGIAPTGPYSDYE